MTKPDLKALAQRRRTALVDAGCCTYEIPALRGDRFILCLCCGKASFNRGDIDHKFCGYCNEYHAEWSGELEGGDPFGQRTSRLIFDWDKNSFFEIAPTSGNRGDYLLHLVATNVDDRHFPRYFFDADNAALESEAWLQRWKNLGDDYRYSPPELTTPIWNLAGKDCEIQLSAVTNCLAIGSYVGTVFVPQDKEDMFVVDAPDLFPRFYFHQAIAISELTAWAIRRGQI